MERDRHAPERRDIESPLGALAAARVAFKLSFKLIRLRLIPRGGYYTTVRILRVSRVARRKGETVWCGVLCCCRVLWLVSVTVRRTREARSSQLNTQLHLSRISFNNEHALSAEEAVIIRIEVIQQQTHSW